MTMTKQGEPTITHEGVTYKISDLNEEGKKQFLNLQATDMEIKRLKMQLAIAQTALNVYEQAIIQQLPNK